MAIALPHKHKVVFTVIFSFSLKFLVFTLTQRCSSRVKLAILGKANESEEGFISVEKDWSRWKSLPEHRYMSRGGDSRNGSACS